MSAPPLPPVPRTAAPLRQQVLDRLRQAIVSARLPPGSRLVERELIAMLGVSRTVVREALRQLESDGLVSIVPNKGPIVRELTVQEAGELYGIRAVLEGLAARLFAEHAEPAQLKRLARALRDTAIAYRGGDPEHILAVKNRFYAVLFEGAGSATLSGMIATLHGRIWRWRALGLGHPHRSRRRSSESLKALRAVLAAIGRGDSARAEALMREEVNRAAKEVTRLVRDAEP